MEPRHWSVTHPNGLVVVQVALDDVHVFRVLGELKEPWCTFCVGSACKSVDVIARVGCAEAVHKR